MLRLLTFTTLYPNAAQPTHGVFVENRLVHLIASGKAMSEVIAPICYVPKFKGLPKRYVTVREAPLTEERHGISIHHPRYPLLPKVGMLAAPLSLYAAAKRYLLSPLGQRISFDLIDAHYFYPDGVAAIMLGRYFQKPVTITARGSDVTLLPQYRLPKHMIRWAANEAAGIVTVCQALKGSLVALGVQDDKIRVLRNGVNLEMFNPGNRTIARAKLGFAGTTLLSVGHLIQRKGHDIAIKALPLLNDPQTTLVIVGDGEEKKNLSRLAQKLDVHHRVKFIGRIPHRDLPDYYRAADALLLLSSREGWANVLLESLACGTPVVATNVNGTPEVITPKVGELVYERSAEASARSIDRLMARSLKREDIRRYAEDFNWDPTTEGQCDLFTDILRRYAP